MTRALAGAAHLLALDEDIPEADVHASMRPSSCPRCGIGTGAIHACSVECFVKAGYPAESFDAHVASRLGEVEDKLEAQTTINDHLTALKEPSTPLAESDTEIPPVLDLAEATGEVPALDLPIEEHLPPPALDLEELMPLADEVDRQDLGIVSRDRPAYYHEGPTASRAPSAPAVDVRRLLAANGWRPIAGQDAWIDPTTNVVTSARAAVVEQSVRSGQPRDRAVAIAAATFGEE